MIELSGKNVLVTGATGLLGRPLVDALIKRGAKVTGIGFESLPADWPRAAAYLRADLSEFDGWTNQTYEIDYIFHLAGAKGGVGIGQTKAADFMRGNILSTVNMFSEIISEDNRPQRILYVSSVGAYPGDRVVFNENEDIWRGPPHRSDFYGGVSKRFGEALCEAHRVQHGIDYVVVRPTNCFGPYDRFDPETGMVIAALIARAEAGERPLKVWGDGLAMRDFLYSKDAAEQMILAMTRGESGEAYNLGTGKAVSLGAVLGDLKAIYRDLEWQFDYTKPSGPGLRQMDMRKLAALGVLFCARMPLALTETVEWYRANKSYAKYDPFKERA